MAQRVRELVSTRSISLYRLEKLSGILHGTLASIMNGKTKTVTLSTIIMICEGLNVQVSEFFDSPLFKISD